MGASDDEEAPPGADEGNKDPRDDYEAFPDLPDPSGEDEDDKEEEPAKVLAISEAEVERLLAELQTLKEGGNVLFKNGFNEDAVTAYAHAVTTAKDASKAPNYLEAAKPVLTSLNCNMRKRKSVYTIF